ncbi:hypothetical protein DL98DRAFT_587764 [Cadophora sp. DSE1049]|nr:hypothetical protein DL98DRAFT_587764 [Cadophora sp. DSE1049]
MLVTEIFMFSMPSLDNSKTLAESSTHSDSRPSVCSPPSSQNYTPEENGMGIDPGQPYSASKQLPWKTHFPSFHIDIHTREENRTFMSQPRVPTSDRRTNKSARQNRTRTMSGFDYHLRAARLSQFLRGVQSQPTSTGIPAGPVQMMLSNSWQYQPVWPSPDPTLSTPSNSISTTSTNPESDPKSTLTIPAELPTIHSTSLYSVNTSLTNEEIMDRIAQLLGKGRVLIGYKVNQEWLTAQLEMDEGKREVRFVRREWMHYAHMSGWNGWNPVNKAERCYVLDVDVDEEHDGSGK